MEVRLEAWAGLIGGMMGIVTLGGGGVGGTLRSGRAIGTLGSVGVFRTLRSGGAGRPDKRVIVQIVGIEGWLGRANRIIFIVALALVFVHFHM